MKAVMLKGFGSGRIRAEVVEAAVPSAGPGELLVEMKACGLCGTDVEKIKGEYTAAMPVLGHEAVGVVSSAGEGAGDFREGDRVFPHHHVPCGTCYYCMKGSETMCEDYRKSNLDPGGFAEYFRVPRWNVDRGGVLRIPASLELEVASLVEPVACCMRALDRCGVKEGDSALVVGAGPVGMAHALLLRSMDSEVMVSDVSQSRLKFAEQRVGRALDATKLDVPQEVRKTTGGRGVDLAIVASGSPKAVVQALGSVRRGGRVCLFGIPPKGSRLEYDLSDVYNSEVSVISSYGATEAETTRAMGLIASGRVDFASLITHRFPLDEFESGVKASVDGSAMKVVIIS